MPSLATSLMTTARSAPLVESATHGMEPKHGWHVSQSLPYASLLGPSEMLHCAQRVTHCAAPAVSQSTGANGGGDVAGGGAKVGCVVGESAGATVGTMAGEANGAPSVGCDGWGESGGGEGATSE